MLLLATTAGRAGDGQAPPAPEAASAPAPAASNPAPAASAAAPAASVAGGAATDPAPAPTVDDFATGTLWRITAPGGATSHLFGTIHIGLPDDLALPAELFTLLGQARRLVVELSPDAADATQLDRLQRLPAGQSLAQHLKPPELVMLRGNLQRAGLALRQPQLYRPWVLVQLLQAAGPWTPESLDDRLVRQARQAKLPLESLETLAEQLAAFECATLPEQLSLLRETLAVRDGFFEDLNREALALYRQQRTADLSALLAQRFPLHPANRAASERATQCIIASRNQRFAQRLAPLLAQGSAFVAIGAAHLGGPDGVLALLSTAGFGMERIGRSP